jgi:hypothetical protein
MVDPGMTLHRWLGLTPIEPRRWTTGRASLRLWSPHGLPSTPIATRRMRGGPSSGCGRKTHGASGIAHIRCGDFRRLPAQPLRLWTTRRSPSSSAEPSRDHDLASTSLRFRVITHRSLAGLVSSLICSTDLPGTEGDDGPMELGSAPAEHWDQAYGHGDATRSWFQREPSWSLRMLDRAGIGPADSVIDAGGGSSPLAAALLARGHSDITVLDVSLVGIRAAEERLGAAAEHVQWLLVDVRTWRPSRRYVVWHDRALFHFMAADQDRGAYLNALEMATSPDRAVAIFATFAPDGPPRCSGLPVARYSAADLADAIGVRWQMIEESRELHTTPSGVTQPFTWAAFRREH